MGLNGTRPPAFPADTPIIGQPYEIKGWQFTALLICRCETGPSPLLVPSHGFVKCRGCGKSYTILGVSQTPGQAPAFNIGVAIEQPTGPASS